MDKNGNSTANVSQAKVSIIMLAYNHEKYIAQAISSILNQNFKHKFELLIGEDCSSDKTLEIIKTFQKNYPDVIEVFSHNPNIGMHKNFLFLLSKASGEYICICEGDDYWYNNDKLVFQTEFLDCENDYVLICGNAIRYNQNQEKFIGEIALFKHDSDIPFSKLARYNCITTGTIMFRNVINKTSFKSVFYKIISIDWYLYMLLFEKGKFRYVNKVFSVYRENEGSINGRNKRITIEKYEMDFLQLLKGEKIIALDDNKRSIVRNSIAYKYNNYAKVFANSGQRVKALKFTFFSFFKRKFNIASIIKLTETLLFIFLPKIHERFKLMRR